MKRRSLKPLVWPIALLIAGGVTALAAEATSLSVETVTLYGLVKLVSDLVLLIGIAWLVVALDHSTAELAQERYHHSEHSEGTTNTTGPSGFEVGNRQRETSRHEQKGGFAAHLDEAHPIGSLRLGPAVFSVCTPCSP